MFSRLFIFVLEVDMINTDQTDLFDNVDTDLIPPPGSEVLSKELSDQWQAEFYSTPIDSKPQQTEDAMLDKTKIYDAKIIGIDYNKSMDCIDVSVDVHVPNYGHIIMHDLVGIRCCDTQGVLAKKSTIYLSLIPLKGCNKQYTTLKKLYTTLRSRFENQKKRFKHTMRISPWMSAKGHWFFNIVSYKRVQC